MTFRAFALVLTMLLAGTPVVGIACAIECAQPQGQMACHGSPASPDGPSVGKTGHACGHDHATDNVALLTSASPRDSIRPFTVLSMPAFADASVASARQAQVFATHGPPGPSGRIESFQITVLRI